MNIIKKIEKTQDNLRNLIVELSREIRSLPDNPDITRTSERSFIISSSALGAKNWSAQFHDFRSQYETVIGYLESSNPLQILDRFMELVDTGTFYYDDCKVKLHPQVVENLRGVLCPKYRMLDPRDRFQYGDEARGMGGGWFPIVDSVGSCLAEQLFWVEARRPTAEQASEKAREQHLSEIAQNDAWGERPF